MTADIPPLNTLADRVTWLIEQAHPAGQGPMSDRDVALMVSKTVGRKIDRNTIWKLRTGQTRDPSWWLIDGLSRAFGVPAGWFSGSLDGLDGESVTAQIALLGELRDLGVTAYHLNTVRRVDPGVRTAIITMLELAEREMARHAPDSGPVGDGESDGSPTRSPSNAAGDQPEADR